MELVVTLALVVLIAVFLFSLWMLVVTCQRRRRYNRLIESQTQMRFSKLRQENLDDIVQLGPHISQTLDRNQWVDEVATDLLQHCVAVLKLCHSMTECMAKIPLDQQCSPELNALICKATSRVMPRFEALLRSMANSDMDIRVIEARVGALVSSCWALTAPISVASPEHKEQLDEWIAQMDQHLQDLQLALDMFEEEQRQLVTDQPGTSAQQTEQKKQNHQLTRSSPQRTQKQPLLKVEEDGQIAISIQEQEEEASTSLLPDEAPVDPAIK